MNYDIKGILYFDILSFQRHVAKDIINFIIKNSPQKIRKYGFSEITKRNISPDKIELLVNNLCNYPEYFSGDIYLSDGKGLLFHLDYKVAHVLVIRIFGQSKKLSIQEDFMVFFKKLTTNKLLSYGFVSNDSLLRFQNFKVENKNSNSTESYEGLNLKHGIPGLYEINYFSEEYLPIHFRELPLLSSKINNGYILSFDNLKKEQLIDLKRILGEKEFFGSKNSTTSYFTKRFSNPSSINNYQIPQYTNRVLQKLTQDVISYQFDVLIKDSQIKDFQDKIIHDFSNLSTEKEYLLLIASAGNILKEYLLQFLKSKKPNDSDGQIHLIQNEDIYTINPYNVIALLIEDYLEITDFLAYLKLKFGIK